MDESDVEGADDSRRREPRHPIGVAAGRTELSQDVLRVWERRYGAVTPGRGDGGRRLYSDADIDRLRALNAATRSGRSISQLARLPTEEIARIAAEDAREARRPGVGATGRSEDALIDDAVALTRSLDAERLEASLRRSMARDGLASFITAVVEPLLVRIGAEWEADRLTPAGEHMASAVIEDLLMESIRLVAVGSGGRKVLVATLEGEAHAIGAAVAAAVAAGEGWQVVYLGADLPAVEIARAAILARADLVAVSQIYSPDPAATVRDIRSIAAALPPPVSLVAGGAAVREVAPQLVRDRVRVVADMAGYRAVLRADLGPLAT